MNYYMRTHHGDSNRRERKQIIILTISLVFIGFIGFMAGRIIEAGSHELTKRQFQKQVYELEQQLDEYRTELSHYRGEYSPKSIDPNSINETDWATILSE